MTSAQTSRMDALFSRTPECFDCTAPNPRWASINHGVLLCIRCAGIHRSLGVHISRVRSLTMDAIDPASLALLERVGNRRGRAIFEATLPAAFAKPSASTSPEHLEEVIRMKWERKAYASDNWRAMLAGNSTEKHSRNSVEHLLEFPTAAPRPPVNPRSLHTEELLLSSPPQARESLVDVISAAFEAPFT